MDRHAPAVSSDPRSQVSRPLEHLTPQERAVYYVLAENAGRVLSRSELARAVGIADLSERRCDSLIVGVRRALGSGRVRTVRRRGWMLVGSRASSAERLTPRRTNSQSAGNIGATGP